MLSSEKDRLPVTDGLIWKLERKSPISSHFWRERIFDAENIFGGKCIFVEDLITEGERISERQRIFGGKRIF